MSNSLQMHEKEARPLNTTPGSADEDDTIKDPEANFRNNKYHRRLAMCSIICGVSCIGIQALTYSFKAEHTGNRATAEKARKYSIISIVVFFSIIVSIPILMALFSYLVTLGD
ncbi:transmembrane protein 265 [Austrofundulus limnaeus]|uniref:Transmembrane protein 265 n=1 Tax=Austrofundulus limnaeus TaxID=52670 RepID=A0A2I4D0B9_AUSLI|nr:PREDICTED: transmembrane protein 265 [Austrofundulus limnaeus]XP_013885688.1 PREDICTED: transmembrane protein 265 [Austrofundulus limnaeus]